MQQKESEKHGKPVRIHLANSAPKQAAPRQKRIVSRSEYAAGIGRKAALGVGSMVLAVGMLVCCLIAVFFLIQGIGVWGSDAASAMVYFLGGAVGVGGALYFIHTANLDLKRAHEVDTGVLLTRATIDHLPARESLVRAAQEPVHAQQSVLLRAATMGQATPPEQLVRPAGRQEETA